MRHILGAVGTMTVLVGVAFSVTTIVTVVFGVHVSGTPLPPGFDLLLITVGLIAVAVNDIARGGK